MADKKALTRRGFISTAATMAASAGMISLGPAAALAQTEEKTKPGELIYRTLGRTGMKMPIVGMGVMNASNPEVVQASYELGVRHFDTAAIYQHGRNEEMVGKVIGKLKVRDKVFIATKIWSPGERPKLEGKEKKEALIKTLDESLARLKMDYVDILYLHAITKDDFGFINDPYICEALNELKEMKKIRACGVSTHQNLITVMNDVAEKEFYDIVLTVINISLAKYPEINDAIANVAKKGIGVIAMKTQAGGRQVPNPEALDKYSTSMVNIASLKWVLQNENITAAIPGYDNFDHMKEDFSVASNLEFTKEEKEMFGEQDIKLGFNFCENCEKCLASCPYDTDIPSLMRTHMYAMQYGNPIHARQTLDSIPHKRSLSTCTSCDDCTASCAYHLDIPRQIGELKEIFV